MKKSKFDLVKRWLEKARRDLNTAHNCLDSSEPFPDIICFHAQQAAEKYLKAYLVYYEIEFPKTHSLEDLILLANRQDSSFLNLQDISCILTPYAVEVRYGESEEPMIDDAIEAIEIAEQVKVFIFKRLPNEMMEE